MKHMSSLLAPAAVLPAEALEEPNQGLALEGFKDALKAPLKALKKAFPQTSEAVFQKEIELKRALLVEDKKNTEKVKAVMTNNKDTKSHTVSLKRLMKKINFTATTPEQVIAGLQKNRKFIIGLTEDVSKATEKSQAEKVLDRFDAEMNKKGMIREEMIVNKSQALKIIDENLALTQATIDLLDVLEKLSKNHLSTEGLGSFIGGVFASIVKACAMFFISVLLWVGFFAILTAIFSLPWWIILLGVVPAFLGYGLMTSEEQEKAHHLLDSDR